MTARLLLVRHGQTTWHAENRYAGITDVPLTEEGERQARGLGAWAARRGVDALACSPMSRARETARPAAEALGLEPHVLDGLREMDFGWGEGRTVGEMEAESPERLRAFREDAREGAFPGSEPVDEVAARVCGALRGLAAETPPDQRRTVLVVAHNTALRIALCSLLGIPLGRYRLVLPRLDNAAVTEIELDGAECGRAALRALNLPTGAAA
ncbi:histidine phosphatase family protein [Streptomyces sp. ODS28]|uniref:histidine phosphatase family protein n=1 Tax=Streptomyces sp. ODS28 TaxID=3136688 RepID=UPI0031EB1406